MIDLDKTTKPKENIAYRPNEKLYQQIKEICLAGYDSRTTSIQMLEQAWEHPDFPMHCPEHHFLVTAVLLAMYRALKQDAKAQLEIDLAAAEERSKNILPGFCGWYGACGAAIGSGIFFSILTDTNPYSTETWGLANLLTADSLREIAVIGGPRCCKRVCYTTVKATTEFMRHHLGLDSGKLESIHCRYHAQNAQCRKTACPYYGE